MTAKTQNIVVLGAGTVGSQVIRLINEHRDDLQARSGAVLNISAVLVRNLDAERDYDIDPELLTTDAEAAIDGADIVIELIGGIEPAYTYVKCALNNGSTVITGNKALLAQHGPELYELTAENDTDLYYEAAVAGAVPIVYGLRESMAGDRVNRIIGIVNGTTNFILDQMATTGASYDDALKEAQDLGFAEADPTADVEGLDAAAKCAIMASLAFHSRVSMEDVDVEGITNITAQDMQEAAENGMVIKLLAIAERRVDDEGVEGIGAQVYPALVPTTHPLATVSGAFNAVVLENESAGRLMFYGQGAGGAPTASAVLSDLVAGASHRVRGGHAPRESRYAELPILDPGSAQTRYQVRIKVEERAGVLEEVAGIFARHGVSLLAVQQNVPEDGEDVHIVLATHTTRDSDLQAVIDALGKSKVVQAVESSLRVEGDK